MERGYKDTNQAIHESWNKVFFNEISKDGIGAHLWIEVNRCFPSIHVLVSLPSCAYVTATYIFISPPQKNYLRTMRVWFTEYDRWNVVIAKQRVDETDLFGFRPKWASTKKKGCIQFELWKGHCQNRVPNDVPLILRVEIDRVFNHTI